MHRPIPKILQAGIRDLLLAATGLQALSCAQCVAGDLLSVDSVSWPVQWTIRHAGKPILVYAADPQKFKPYVQALYTVKGYGVLRDAAFDHLHHHALMYGIKVNGVNFWEETSGSGVQKVVESSPPETFATPRGLAAARWAQLIYWLAPQDAFLPNSNAPALLIERRTLTLVINTARQETALHWKSRFEVGSKTNEVILTGANYHGLGLRFLKELDPVATHFTPEGKPDLANGRQDVSAHAWEAVAFDAPGQPATIAIFGAASNARGSPAFFAMKTPFAYLAATQGLDQEPLVYRRGESFELNYLVTLYPEVKTAEALAQRAREWDPAAQ